MKLDLFRSQLKANHYNNLFETLYGINQVRETTERYLAALDAFEKNFPGYDDIAVLSTPGRTEIGGNHTDHNAGYVLAAAINKDIISIVTKTAEPLVKMISEGYAPCVVSLDSLVPDEKELFSPSSIIRGVAARLQELSYNIGGFAGCSFSTVPNGAGLSSSAAFEVQICTIFSHLYNDGRVGDVLNAQIAQYSENNFFGKPCGLMDQMACSVGGMIQIDFEDFDKPVIKPVAFDFASSGHKLFIVETRGSHADLNDDYVALEHEMKQTAQALGAPVLRFTSKDALLSNLASLRGKVNDRAILRAFHFFNDSERVLKQTEALERGDFEKFKFLITDSGLSSFMYCQNVYSNSSWQEQGVSIGLMLAEDVLAGRGAWRVHGGGFAGTIMAFVPDDLASEFKQKFNLLFGDGACHETMIRPRGTMRIDS